MSRSRWRCRGGDRRGLGRLGRDDALGAARQELRVHAPDRRRPAVHGRPRRVRGEPRPRRQGRGRPPERGAEGGRPLEVDPRSRSSARRTGRRRRAPRSRRRRSSSSRTRPTCSIGEMASSATIPMAQSVAIPNNDRPDLADLERAADHATSRTTATSGGRIRPTRCRARCSRRPRSTRSAQGRRSTSARATTRSAPR